MTRHRISIGILAAIACHGMTSGASLDSVPWPVSPGHSDHFAPVSSPCPTFSWSAARGAEGYELAVFLASQEGDPGPVVGEAVKEAAIHTSIPGRALSWTPSADLCHKLSGSLAWFIRSVSGGHAGEWSQALLFDMKPQPSVQDIGNAVERALGRFLAERGIEVEPNGRLTELISQELISGAPVDRASAPAGAGAPEPRTSERIRSYRGEAVAPRQELPRLVFVEDAELVLVEDGSSSDDYVQLVFDTPTATGALAWSLAVRGNNGIMFLSSPLGTDSIVFFTDASVMIPELRDLRLRVTDTPPSSCASGQEGFLYYDDSLGELCDCNGSSWQQVDGGGAC